MIKTDATIGNLSRALYRYPSQHQHKSLQAWDAADELLVNHVLKNYERSTKLSILNDDFGALACFLNDYPMLWYSDSKVATHGMIQNWQRNQLGDELPAVICELTDLTATPVGLIKLPKSNEFLTEILITIRERFPENTEIVTAGKVNQIHTSTLKLFEKHLGPTKTSLAKKKARLIFSSVDKTINTKSKYPKIWATESGIELINLANVFANQQLDIGARIMLQHLPGVEGKSIIDLGCGNGVLGAHLMLDKPKSVHFVDDSYMAVKSSGLTIEKLITSGRVEASQADFHHSNCLEDVAIKGVDIVVCNPPFHQQNTITDHIAWQMFTDAHQKLRKGGELRIVGNRHLDYHQKLKRIFGGCKVIASDRKFVILSSIKK